MTDNQTERVERPHQVGASASSGDPSSRENGENHTGSPAQLGFDQVMQRLRDVVGQLEHGNLSLEQSLRAYEQGVGLARQGHTLLDSAEKRVELLVRDQQSGVTAVPFGGGDPDAEPAPD